MSMMKKILTLGTSAAAISVAGPGGAILFISVRQLRLQPVRRRLYAWHDLNAASRTAAVRAASIT
jgi:hypothetical protein